MAVQLSPIAVMLRSRERPIRYSILALEEFDRAQGYTLAEAFSKPVHAIKMRDIATALHIGMKYGGNEHNYTSERVLKMIDADVEAQGLQALSQIIDGIAAAVSRATAFKRNAHGEPETEEIEGPFASGNGEPPPKPEPTN